MYAKLFERITDSSLMEESIPTRYAFMAMIAIADRTGVVVGTDIAIARRINMPVAMFREAITRLGMPDPDSNTPALDGRRVVPSEGEAGYLVVNYRTYRDLRNEHAKREYMRGYMQERRLAKKANMPVNEANKRPLVSSVNRMLAHADLDADSDAAKDGCGVPHPCPAGAGPAAVEPAHRSVGAAAASRPVEALPETGGAAIRPVKPRKKRRTADEMATHAATVDVVVEHYRSYHPQARPGVLERELITTRLMVDRFTPAELCQAIDGQHRSPHHLGQNDNGTKYLGLELAMRNSAKVNQFIAIADARQVAPSGSVGPVPRSQTEAKATTARLIARLNAAGSATGASNGTP